MSSTVTAKHFKDNTDYNSIFDNLGSNHAITTDLEVKNFSLSNDGILQATLYIQDISQDIRNIINAHPNHLQLNENNEIHIHTTLETKGSRARNTHDDGVMFDIPGTVDKKWQPLERTQGISIDRRSESKQTKTRQDKHDAL